MSFRYSNYMTGAFKQRIMLQKSLDAISLKTYTGISSCQQILVKCNAYGKILDISSASSASKTNNPFVDSVTQQVLTEPLSQAIRVALFDANSKIRQDKEEAYRLSLQAAPELIKNDDESSFEKWFQSNNGASLPPYAYEAIKDEPKIEALSSSSSSSSSEKKTKSFSIFGEVQAENNNSMSSCMPEIAAALLQLEFGSNAVKMKNQKQKIRLDDGENSFWQRVDLIRRAQLNTIGPRKRRYEFEAPTKTNEFVEKVKMSFTK